jgi:hypothetical protein
VSARQPTSVVPLEAGAGPENPPCPACGEPLFGWIEAKPWLAGAASRCESCGLGAVGGPGEAGDALAALDRLGRDGRIRIANRAGFSAWLGGAGWAGLDAESHYLFTVDAVRRLVAQRDQVVKRARWSPRAGVAAMWQTLLNSATFGHDVLVGSTNLAPREWQRRIDWLTVGVLAIPAFLVALPLELTAATLRQGSVVSLKLELL